MSNRKAPEIEEEVQYAEELLASNVLPSEYEELMGQRFELNDAIRWKQVEARSFKDLVEFTEEVLFEPTEFSRFLPTSNLFDKGAFLGDVENGGDRETLRRHFLTLLTAKKILGILKTRVKAELDAIQSISPSREEELIGIMEGARAKTSQKEEDREVIPLPPPKSKVLPEEESTGEIVMSVKVKGKKPKKDCPHSHTRKTYRNDVQGITHEEVFCKMCSSWLSEEEVTPLTARISKRKKDCEHRHAEWVPGQEGKVARCAEPHCGFILERAHTYRWQEAGLEPFGDDPSKDEVLFFGGNEMEMKA